MTALISFRNFRRIVLLLTAVIAVLFLIEAARFIPVTDENVHTESAYIVSAQRWAQGLPLYSDFRKPPYLITPFPPLWYSFLLLAQRAGITGIDALTLFGRALSMGALIGIVCLLFWWNRRRGFDRESSLLSCTFYLGIPLLMPMAVIARQDLPALFFSLLAVLVVSMRPSAAFASLAGVIAGLAFLTKHSSVAAPITAVLWLLTLRRWRDSALFCTLWAIVVIPVMAHFQVASGHTMLMNLSGSKFGPASTKNLHDILIHLMTTSGEQIMLVLFGFALFAFLEKNDNARDRLLKIYFLVSLPLALFACRFANATANHFLEPIMVWALLVPVAMQALEKHWKDAPAQSAFVTVLAVVLLAPTMDVQLWATRNEHPDDVRALKQVVAGKRILSDVSYLGARSANPGFLDPISLNFAEQAGAWSAQPIIAQLGSHGFQLVILHWSLDDPRWQTIRYPRLSPAMRSAIRENYTFCFELDSDFFYAPATADSTSPTSACPVHLATLASKAQQ